MPHYTRDYVQNTKVTCDSILMIVSRQQNKFELTGEKFDSASATLIFKFD